MKKLIYISLLLIISQACSYKAHTYDINQFSPNHVTITFNTTLEAKIVAKRIANNCSKPKRYNNTLLLTLDQLKCSKKDKGFIREKYRNQIDKQLKQ